MGIHSEFRISRSARKCPIRDDPAAGDQGSGAEGLQGSDGLGDEGGLLFDDGVVDGGAEALVEDLDAEQFGAGAGAVLVGAGDGDVEGQDLVGEPGESGLRIRNFYRGPPPGS